MTTLRRNQRDEALKVIVNLARCYKALCKENAPRPERRRYLDRIQATANDNDIILTPSIRAAILAEAEQENHQRGTLDLHA